MSNDTPDEIVDSLLNSLIAKMRIEEYPPIMMAQKRQFLPDIYSPGGVIQIKNTTMKKVKTKKVSMQTKLKMITESRDRAIADIETLKTRINNTDREFNTLESQLRNERQRAEKKEYNLGKEVYGALTETAKAEQESSRKMMEIIRWLVNDEAAMDPFGRGSVNLTPLKAPHVDDNGAFKVGIDFGRN